MEIRQMELLIGVLCMLLACGPIAAARLPDGISHRLASDDDQRGLRLRGAKHPTYSGYFSVDDNDSELFYAYWEAQNPEAVVRDAPIILWLQGGPGCASSFGAFFEVGPYSVTPDAAHTVDNFGTWAWNQGVLFIDQPLGTGYSQPAKNESIPRDEMGMAQHLYNALWLFYRSHEDMVKDRPLFIAGESYGGKYVPSIAAYILQLQDMYRPGSDLSGLPPSGPSVGSGKSALLERSGGDLKVWRKIPANTLAPNFRLAGIAIGNGLTDPASQIPVMSDSAHYMGLVSPANRKMIADKADEVLDLIDSEEWTEAHVRREALRELITNITGLGTMFDVRRTDEYDANKTIDRFMNITGVKKEMGAREDIDYVTCSKVVGDIMAADTMQSVKHLFPDILERISVLLYQGQFDILDGVASSIAWIDSLDWPLQQKMEEEPGELWSFEGQVAGWTRAAGNLRHTVIYRAGHMVPHDQPEATRAMIEGWIKASLGHK